MKKGIKILVMCVAAPVLWTVVFWKIAMYSAIWQSQFKPTEGVQVTTKDGQSRQGALHQLWGGDWVLVQSDQSRLTFRDDQVLSMLFPARVEQSQTKLSKTTLLETWRSWLPVIAYSLASVLAFVAFAQQRRLRNSQNRDQ